MITIENSIRRPGGKFEYEFRGLSDDEKPEETYGGVKIANGSIFLEMDTQKLWFYDGDTNEWVGNEEE